MSAKNDKTVQQLVEAIRAGGRAKTSPYDTTATVRRIEDGVAWVHIPGGVDETPVKLTIAAQPGDSVQVRVSGGRAFLVGNATAPPTDDRTANRALNIVNRTFRQVNNIQGMIDRGELNGKDGNEVTQVIPEYCLANARAIPAGGTFEDIQYSAWQETVPDFVTGKFYWTRMATYYADGSVTYSDPIFDMTNQVTTEAKAAADNAAGAASTAASIANQALGTATDTAKYFWADSSGAHVSDHENSVGVGTNSQTISSDGTVLMRNGKIISSWTGDSSSNAAINFYDCTRATAQAGDLIASFGRAGVTQYINNIVAMALTASGLSFYTPDSDHYLEAVFGPSGTNLYAAGKLAMQLASGVMRFLASDGTTEQAKFSENGLDIYGTEYNTTSQQLEQIEIAHLGYGQTYSEGRYLNGKYFTLGSRNSSYNIGYMSATIGEGNSAPVDNGVAIGTGNHVGNTQGVAVGVGLNGNGTTYGRYNQSSHDFVVGVGDGPSARRDGLYMDYPDGDLHVYNDIIPGSDQFTPHSVAPSAVNVTSGTWTEIASYSIQETGVYLIVYGAAFSTNATGYRQLYLGRQGTVSAGRWSPSIPAVSGEQTRFGGSDIYTSTLAPGDELFLYARQNSGSTLATYGWIKLIKIGAV